MQKLLQAMTNTDCGFQREAPQSKLVGIDARHINSGLKKKPDCCARAELIREVVIYLVISF